MQKIVKFNRAFLYCCMVAMFCLSPLFTRSEPLQGKPLTISIKNTSLAEVLRQISKKSGVYIYFQDADLSAYPSVSIDVKNKAVDVVLHELLDGRGLTWVEVDKNSIAIRKKEVVIYNNLYSDTSITVLGRVVNEKGQPVIGATILVRGSKIGTTSDSKGNFSITALKISGTLAISGVGFITQEIPFNNQFNLGQITLREYIGNLDETVVIAYGTTTKRFATGNISTIKAKEIESQPVNNPLLALQGRVPGLFIEQATGFSGTGVKVRIQGQNSINNGNDPLYVIDGVPYTPQLLPGLTGVLGGSGGTGQGNPLTYINPSEIESIDVLKDADATSIYGSRAANGAILITMKKGKAGKTKVDLNLQSGWSRVAKHMDVLNSKQYIEMRREGKKNDNRPVLATDYDINGFWDTTHTTNWQKELLGGNAKYNDAQLSLSGGSTNTQFLIGAGYHSETTVFPGNFNDDKISFHFNVNNTSLDQKFKINLTASYLFDNNELPNADLTSNAISLAPTAPTPLNADGSINWAPTSSGASTYTSNPLSYILNEYSNKTTNLISSSTVSYQILPSLQIKSSFGYTSLQSNEVSTYPLTSFKPEDQQASGNSLRLGQYGVNTISSWIIEPQATFKKMIGKGDFEVLLGSTFQQNTSNGEQSTGSNYTSDDLLKDKRSASSIVVNNTTNLVYKYSALFARLNYKWQNKYIINLTGRRDGSSRFGKKNQFNNFAAIGAGWIFSNENIFKSHFNNFSFGKLRASYGSTGNDQIMDYQFLSLYQSVVSDVSYQGVTGLGPTGLTNPYLQWELTKKMQLGLDLGFYRDNILLSVSYFDNRSSNQLLGYGLAGFAGYNSIISNFPAKVQNNGWEITLSSINLRRNSFSWNTSINLTIPSNKLLDFKDISSSSYSNSYTIGQPLSMIRVYHYLGVNKTTGIYEFADSKGNPTSSPNDLTDTYIQINSAPKYYGGLQNSVTYGQFDFDFNLQFVNQKGIGTFFGSSPGFTKSNQPISVLDRWQNPGDEKPIQRYIGRNTVALTAGQLVRGSDANWVDASYVRLKNISFSWRLPNTLNKRLFIQSARFYIQAQNLITFTHYNGLDPETKSSTTLPPLRTISCGFQIKL